MSRDAYRYVTLLCSLPHLRPPFHWERPPISRVRLEQRLTLLEARDRALLARVEAVARPYRGSGWHDDAALLGEARDLLAELGLAPLADWLVWWLTLDVLTAALRARRDGQTEAGALSAAPRVGRRLRDAWQHPTFALATRYPWLTPLADQVQAGDSLAVETTQLELGWDYLARHRPATPYGLEAVAHYLFRWWLIERRCRQDGPGARQRFREALVTPPDLDSTLEAFA
ncbi:hypothetical protein [Modicisalibacter coralii]|uniref:hypothetical protein n=1 Tax=Modicisalibacter coralii TaxID=2304602 RepID=UPI00100BF026|nr:hypothetical protein [Halomonas coralii]